MTRGALVLAVVSLAGCSVGFDSTITAMGQIQGLLDSSSAFSQVNATSSLSESFSTNGTSASHVTSAKVSGGTLSVVNPTQAQDTLVYISSFDITASGPPPLQTVTIATVPASAFASRPTSVNLTGADVELKPYIESGSITMTPNVTFSSHPASPINIQLSLTIHVDVSP